MKLKIKTTILLIITSLYILPISKAELNAFYLDELDQPNQRSIPQILKMDIELSYLSTLSEKTSKTVVPSQVIHMVNQTTLEKGVWQSEINYSENNDLHIYHPLIIYKISLSAHTSDG